MITKSSLDALKDQIDIIDVISNSIEIRKAGANFKACCPFHGEDTPSFVISPTKQIYHCFGCGVGGDAIKFVQEYDKLNFQEAVEKIADDMNFTLEYESNTTHTDYKATMETINSFYEANLVDKKLQYLLDRGITKESIKTFEIGYAPRSDVQVQLLKDNYLNLNDAIEAGVLAQDKENIYARLRERITFPIRNHANKLIGFGGRTLRQSEGIAKYLNSPDTKLFNKSRNLYGFNLAKEHIYKKGTMVVTEGYLDVVMMHQANIKTAVATMGTALTQQHIPIIKKCNCRVLLCYDGDNAGKTAAHRAAVLLSQHEVDGGVIIFEDNLDPADMVKDGKIEQLYEMLKNPMPLIEYVLRHIIKDYDLDNPHNKNQALSACISYLKTINLLVAEEYKGVLSKLLNIASHHITLGQTTIKKDFTIQSSKTVSKADEKFFKTIIEKPDYLDLLFGNLDYEVYENNTVFEDILSGKNNSDAIRPLLIRDDIVIYNKEDFIRACKLKQKSYLSEKLKQLSTSLDDDVFEQMDKVQKRLNEIG
ncbi:DNA primase [Halarcobacter anaerophilus]|uniref:DNA primase n=1 Tax=Halarcobacter anaerophilus TaxID=877500 RepID=A0A4Q0Y0U6_9BACT|nr:DNA primase [Halarcobacter anaerophilus]QDF28957.1 DNA primase [Halarcobacter anaerophilus]RXJ63592.1 DNA primase [Halarcobacter anaerophilus]